MSTGIDIGTRAVPLARVVRGDLVESVHTGHLVIVDTHGTHGTHGTDGTVEHAFGDPDVTLLARSSLKPLQAIAMLRHGLPLDGPDLAIACSSHNAEPAHLERVRAVLAGSGLTEAALQNTPDLPLDPAAAFAWQSSGHVACALTQNCSGKHAAMLATCVVNGWDLASYLDPGHPLQVAIRQTLEDLTGVAVTHATVDGCGAPLFSTTLTGLARAFGAIAAAPREAPGSPQARVAAAMTADPWLVAGTGREATGAMLAVPGLVAKDGADGVYGAGLPDGRGIAFKITDGSARPRPAVLVAALLLAGLDPSADVDALRAVGDTPVLGHGAPVGQVVPTVGLPVDA
jgi:L-asparaginase II